MILQSAVIIFGLILFEVISSVDNAIINAHVLRTVPERFRRIFLVWGLLLAVFLIRGVLPFLIIWLAAPGLSFGEIWNLALYSGNDIEHYLEKSKPLLLLCGGVYLFLVFLGWLFMEEKKYAFFVEHFIHRQAVWFYAFSSVFFTVIIWISLKINPILALSAALGTTAFFITDGFKKNAEVKEKELLSSH